MTNFDKSKAYNKYAQDIVDGKVVACQNIILACKRFISWFERDDIYFDYDDVDAKIRFVGLMKHSTGSHNGKPFALLPWQQWCFAGIYGWKWKETNLRVTENVLMFMARKNGKTALAAAIALVASIKDNENQPEIEFIANSAAQARIGFEATTNYAESLDQKKKVFQRFRNNIRIPRVKGLIQVLASDSMSLDGYNSSLFIIDEFHAARDWSLYNVMKSSQGMREQPLSIIITTAGFLLTGYPCYEMREVCIDILKGLKRDDSMFCALYEPDKDDDWTDSSTWIKSNPSLGQTVKVKYLEGQVKDAKNNTSLEIGIKTKNFNIFCQSASVWIADDYIRNSSQDVDINDYVSEESYIGVDLSVVSDLTCTSIMFPPNANRKKNPDKFVFKSYIYIPEEALESSPNKEIYKEWIKNGYAIKTSGNVVDYDYILSEQLKLQKLTALMGVYYDKYNATQWAINAETEGLPLFPYSQSLGNFNQPTKYFEMLVKSGKCIIDNNPAVRWCFGNVELKFDANENCKPVKAGNDKTKKIDPVISMLECIGGYFSANNYAPELFAI